FELLESEVDTLTSIARLSFGNYTNILRSLLNVRYSVYIPWPEEVSPRGSSGDAHWNIIENSSAPYYRYRITPNPVTNSFVVHKISGAPDHQDALFLELYDLSGKLIHRYISQTNDSNTLIHSTAGLYIIRIVNAENGFTESHLIAVK